MLTEVTKSSEQAGQNMKAYTFHWLLLMIVTVASASNAQTGPAQRSKPTINRPGVVAESDTQKTIFQRCAEANHDASYLIPRQEDFPDRIEASGSGAYAYKPAGDCRYWVVNFSMNRYSNTRVDPVSGATIRDYVDFFGAPFDLPSSERANETQPIVEEDCKRLELDVFIYRKDPAENTFKMIKSGRRRFLWDNTTKRCNMDGVAVLHTERAPTANLLTIRIAVRVKLRGTWQQAAGYAIKADPN